MRASNTGTPAASPARTSVPPYLRTSVPPYLRTSVPPYLNGAIGPRHPEPLAAGGGVRRQPASWAPQLAQLSAPGSYTSPQLGQANTTSPSVSM
jgi:hypothetical protein